MAMQWSGGVTESTISPWVRPVVILSVLVISFGVALATGLVDIFFPGAGLRFGTTVAHTLTKLPSGVYDLLEVVFSVYGVAKTVERVGQTYTSHKYSKGEAP